MQKMAGICCLVLYLYNQANSIERLETAAIQVECHQRIAGKVEGYLSKHFDNIMKKNLLLIVGIVFFYSCNGVQFDSGFGDELYSKMEKELKDYKDSLKSKTPEEIMNSAYQLALKEEMICNFYPECLIYDI